MKITENLVDAAIIGAQKAGTTSLLRWLGQHPGIRAQRTMEFSYFIDRERFEQRTFEQFFQKNFAPAQASGQLTLIKHVGLFDNEAALWLLREHNPAARLIVVLREPAERAWSAFWYALSRGHEPETDFERAAFGRPRDYFSDPFRQRSTDYVARGFYCDHLQVLEKKFSREQICLIAFEDLKKDPRRTCDEVFRFLGLAPHPVVLSAENKTSLPRFPGLSRALFWLQPLKRYLPESWRKFLKIKVERLNRSAKPAPAMPDEVRRRLEDIFREKNQQLYAEYGIDYRAGRGR